MTKSNSWKDGFDLPLKTDHHPFPLYAAYNSFESIATLDQMNNNIDSILGIGNETHKDVGVRVNSKDLLNDPYMDEEYFTHQMK